MTDFFQFILSSTFIGSPCARFFPDSCELMRIFTVEHGGWEKRGGAAAGVVGYLAAGFEFTDISEHARCESCFVYGDDDDGDDKRRRTCTVHAETWCPFASGFYPAPCMPPILASRHTSSIHRIMNPWLRTQDNLVENTIIFSVDSRSNS